MDYPALGVQGVHPRGLQHFSVVCLLRGVADGGGEPWVIAGVRAMDNHVRGTVRCVGMVGHRTFGYHNPAVCVLTVLIWAKGADCILRWLRPAWAMVAGHVCDVAGSVLAVLAVVL